MIYTNVGNPVQSCPNNSAGSPEQETDPQKHFINFKVVDDNGNPIENVVLHVILPDGSSEERSTDKNGMMEIKNIEPGNCKIEADWKTHKVFDAALIMV